MATGTGSASFPAITGAVAASESLDTLAATGTVINPAITGTIAATEAPDTLSAAGFVLSSIAGSVAATEAPDALTAAGMVLSTITGSVTATESPDALVAFDQAARPAAGGGGGGAGSMRDVRAFADELDREHKPTKAQKKRRKLAVEAAVIELLPDEPAAALAVPYITQLITRSLPPATWQPVYGPREIVLPPAAVAEVRAKVEEWRAMQALLADIEDELETELLLGAS